MTTLRRPRLLAFVASAIFMLVGAARAEAQTQSEEPPPPAPWRADLSLGQTLNATAFDRSAQQTYDPKYAWSAALRLRWFFTETLFVGARESLDMELTESNFTVREREVLLSDARLEVGEQLWRHDFDAAHSFVLRGIARLSLPTSRASQAATLIAAPAGLALGSFVFSDVLQELALTVGSSYLHRFQRTNVVTTEVPYPCALNGLKASIRCSVLGTDTNLSDVASLGLVADLTFNDSFYASMEVVFGWSRALGLSDVTLMPDSGGSVVLNDSSATHWRNQREIAIAAYYSVMPGFTLAVSVTNQFAERGPDGKLRAPFEPLDTLFGFDVHVELQRALRYFSGQKCIRQSVRDTALTPGRCHTQSSR